MSGIGEVNDFTEMYYLAQNMPSGASWYGLRESGILNLVQELPQNKD
jgi:hypothetical protein